MGEWLHFDGRSWLDDCLKGVGCWLVYCWWEKLIPFGCGTNEWVCESISAGIPVLELVWISPCVSGCFCLYEVVMVDVNIVINHFDWVFLLSSMEVHPWSLRISVMLYSLLCLLVTNLAALFVLPELSSVRDYVITHSVRSMYVVCNLRNWSTYIDVLSWDLDTVILG